jgi:hypothetical protein
MHPSARRHRLRPPEYRLGGTIGHWRQPTPATMVPPRTVGNMTAKEPRHGAVSPSWLRRALHHTQGHSSAGQQARRKAVVNFIQTLPQYGSYPHARTMCEAFTPAISQFMAPGTRRLAGDFLQSGDAEIWRSYARKNLKGPIHRYLGCVDARPGHCRHCPRARSCARQGHRWTGWHAPCDPAFAGRLFSPHPGRRSAKAGATASGRLKTLWLRAASSGAGPCRPWRPDRSRSRRTHPTGR